MSRRKNRRLEEPSGALQNSRLFKAGSKIALGVIVVITFLTLSSCTVKKPEAPTWTTQFTIPLVNRTYEMSEIVEKIDQEGIEMDADSNVIYTITRDIDTVRLDDEELTTPNLSYAVSEQLGIIDIDPPEVTPAAMALDNISTLATYLPGTVPPTSFEIENALPTIDNYTSATVSSGQVWAVVSNNLGFDLSSATLELYDAGNARTIGTPQSFPGGIADGSTDSVLFNLSGQTISNSFEMRVNATTDGGTVLSLAEKEIVTVMRFSDNLTVSAATAEIPGLSRDFSQPVTLDESNIIYHAQLSGGNLQLDVSNQTNLNAELEITFPDLKSSGVPLTVEQPVAANSNEIVVVNLSGYELIPTDSTSPQDIAINVVANVVGTAPQHVQVDQSNQFAVTAALNNLSFASVSGPFAVVESTIEPTQEEIDVPDGFDSIELVHAVLTLEIVNGVNLPGSLSVNLNGNNGKTLNIDGAIAPGSPQSAVTTYIIDTTIADFLSPVPSQIDISGNAAFGNGFDLGTITSEDFVYARINILAPFEVIIPQTTIEGDIESEKIDQDDIDAITDHVIEARFIYNITNHLPIGAQFNLYLGGDSATVFDNPQLLIDSIFAVAAPTTGGIANDVATSGYQTVVLDSNDIKILENETLYIGTEFLLDDSEGQPVRLTNNDYIQVVGRIEVEYNFDGDF